MDIQRPIDQIRQTKVAPDKTSVTTTHAEAGSDDGFCWRLLFEESSLGETSLPECMTLREVFTLTESSEITEDKLSYDYNVDKRLVHLARDSRGLDAIQVLIALRDLPMDTTIGGVGKKGMPGGFGDGEKVEDDIEPREVVVTVEKPEEGYCWTLMFAAEVQRQVRHILKAYPTFGDIARLEPDVATSDLRLNFVPVGDKAHLEVNAAGVKAVDMFAHLQKGWIPAWASTDTKIGSARRLASNIPNRWTNGGRNAPVFYDPFGPPGVYVADQRYTQPMFVPAQQQPNPGRGGRGQRGRRPARGSRKQDIERPVSTTVNRGVILWTDYFDIECGDDAYKLCGAPIFPRLILPGMTAITQRSPVPDNGAYELMRVILDVDISANPRVKLELYAALTQASAITSLGRHLSNVQGAKRITTSKKTDFLLRPGDRKYTYVQNVDLTMAIEYRASPVNVFSYQESTDHAHFQTKADDISKLVAFTVRVGVELKQISDAAV